MASQRFTEDSWRTNPRFRAVCAALRSCKTEEELGNLLRDIATLSELQAWGERLEVAKELARGLSYRQVAAATGASTTTVTRVAKFLEDGEGGYRKYLQREKITSRQPEEPERFSALQALQQRQQERKEQHHEASSSSGERPASALRKYLQ
jgi:TrpR-related protein YerC/YecD